MSADIAADLRDLCGRPFTDEQTRELINRQLDSHVEAATLARTEGDLDAAIRHADRAGMWETALASLDRPAVSL
jgi:hypothetical protein